MTAPPAPIRAALGFDRRRPSLVHPGSGGWWWHGGIAAVSDGARLWILRAGSDAVCARLERVIQVGVDRRGLVAVTDDGWLRWSPSTGSVDRGEHPAGLRGVPGGDERVWVADGFVYREAGGRTTAIDVVGDAEDVAVGPHGALLIGGDGGFDRGAPPGRSPRPLPARLDATEAQLRWSVGGTVVAAPGARIGLDNGRLHPIDGVPAAIDAWHRGDRIVRDGDGRTLTRGLGEASAARWGSWLAGPGGWVWSLRTGAPCARRRVVALGCTVGTPAGFVTVDWETNRGWTVSPTDGTRADPFTLALAPDDTVVDGWYADGAVYVDTALGQRLRIARAEVTDAPGGPDRDDVWDVDADPDEDPDADAARTPFGAVDAAGAAVVDGVRFVWDDAGWLLASPADG